MTRPHDTATDLALPRQLEDSSHAFKLGMRAMAGAVSIVTTRRDGADHGMVATAVCSVCADPPTLLVCVNQKAATHAAVQTSGAFCVNVLGRDDLALGALFGSGIASAQRFAGGDWEPSAATGCASLRGALATFDCRVTQEVHCGTHTIFLGSVVGVRLGAPAQPLIYSQCDYWTAAPLRA